MSEANTFVAWPEEFVTVVLTGEVDIAVTDEVLDACDRATSLVDVPHLVIDLSAVTFMDTSGLGALLEAHKKVTARGGDISLLGATPRILTLMQITRLDRVFPVLSEAPALPPVQA
jgi:anti-anti-sigma factor